MSDPTDRESLFCERCSGVERVLRPLYEGGSTMGWYCPCCKSVLRTGEMVRDEGERRAAEMGLTVEEYSERNRAMFRDVEAEPLSKAERSATFAFARSRAAEWTPACEHDKNPWTTPAGEL